MIVPDIIPVTYAGGSGGAMLTQFLIKAKNLDFSDIELSEHGHAHWNKQDVNNCMLGDGHPDIDKITHLMTAEKYGKIPPYFVPIHLVDMQLSKIYFNKIIRITYTSNDMLDLIYIFVMKNSVDILQLTDSDLLPRLNERHWLLKHKLPYFNQLQSDDNILYVSWQEIYNGDVHDLINRLADFTNIPKINFNEGIITKWRQLTKASLIKIKNRINYGI
jgi:hypothetical protein